MKVRVIELNSTRNNWVGVLISKNNRKGYARVGGSDKELKVIPLKQIVKL
jgi:hypothetical protein